MPTPIKIQIANSLSNLKPSRIIALKVEGDTDFSLYVTDKSSTPFPLKGAVGSTITAVQNTDGNLTVTGNTTKTINVAPALLALINSALQFGDNVSDLVNDANYITLADIPTFVPSNYDLEDFTNTSLDPFAKLSEVVTNLSYTASSTQGSVNSDNGTDATIPLADTANAGLLSPADKTKLNNTSGINSGNQTTIVGITGTKAQFNTSVTDGDILYVGDITQYTDELAQDAVGTILLDTSTVDFTYDDTTPSISAIVKPDSIDATHLADNINISEFINDSGYITDVNLSYTPSATNGIVVNDKGTDATIPLVDFTNAGLLTPEEKQLLYNNSSTGVTRFDGFSINVDTTKYNTGIIEGWFVDNTTNPNLPTKVFKSFPATTGNTLTNLATQNVTYISVDSDGLHHQSGTPFEPQIQRDWTPLGVIVHSNRININAINNQPLVAISPNSQTSDLMESIGFFNIYGNVFLPNGINLNIDKSFGHIFKQGSNFINNNKDPHTLELPRLIAPTNIRYRTQIGTEFADTAVVDTGFYDLAGVRTAIPGTRWSIQRIYIFQSNLIRIQYGQATYTTKVDAIQAISTEAFVVEQNILENGLFRALLIVREGTTDLTDTSKALFIEASKFGSVAGLGSLSTTSLQQAYLNSLTPEVTTNSTLGAVTIKRGSALDIDNVLEVQNGAGTTTGTIDGNGKLTNTAITISSNPITSASTYDILTRNISTGAVEKVDVPTISNWTKTGNDIRNNNSGNIELKPLLKTSFLNSSNIEKAYVDVSGEFTGASFGFASGAKIQGAGNGAFIEFIANNGNAGTPCFNFKPTYFLLGTGGSNVKVLQTGGTYTPTTSALDGFIQFEFNPIINQTGTANQIVRSIYINPTLTSAVDYRAIEVTAGKSVFQEIIANNVVRLKNYTVATLPVGTQGDTAYCTDLLTPTYMATAVGGGSVVWKVFHDGVSWKVG